MNHVVGQLTYCLNVGLKRPGRAISRSVARYVYCVFVDSFDIDNKDLIVSYKDGDGRNLRYSNLFLTDRSQQSKKSFRLQGSWTTFREARLSVRQIPDGTKSQSTSCLLCQLSYKSKKYQQSVARLVYHHFVRKIDLNNKNIRLKYKNNKYYDLSWKNLKL
jgi:hypothetical protein